MKSLLFSFTNTEKLAKLVLEEINSLSDENKVELGNLKTQKFSDNENSINYAESVRGKRVYLISAPRSSDDILLLLLAIDGAKRSGASEIIPILTYMPYSRQDKPEFRGPIGVKVMAEMIEQRGATSVITFDLHADQIQGFFNIPVTHIEGKNVFDSFISKIVNKNLKKTIILCGPDAGSGKRVKRMKDQLQKNHNISLNLVMLDKTRKAANVVDEMIIIGDVKGKDVIILDDMVDTAGTLCKAAEVIITAGANSVRAIISHGILSGAAIEHIGESMLSQLIVSDSLMIPDPMELCRTNYNEERCSHIRHGAAKIRVISVAHQIGLAMAAINNDLSYEALKSNKKETV